MLTTLTSLMNATRSCAARHRRLIVGLAIVVPALLLGGCRSLDLTASSARGLPTASYSNAVVQGPDLTDVVEQATARMLRENPKIADYEPMIATTFVNIDDFRVTSTLGRITAEMMASAIASEGIMVHEVRMRDSLFIEERHGEVILTRRMQQLSERYGAQTALLGTYAVGQHYVYVSARVVRTANSRVLGATSFRVPMNGNTRALLGTGGW